MDTQALNHVITTDKHIVTLKLWWYGLSWIVDYSKVSNDVNYSRLIEYESSSYRDYFKALDRYYQLLNS